ncbi:MAG: hypothetical protein AB7S90_09250 [Marinobacterium sp.]
MLKIIYFLLAAIPSGMYLVWRYLGYHYKERHESNEHRISLLKEENEKLKSKADPNPITWEKALNEIRSMEEVLTVRTNRLLEEKDAEILSDYKEKAILILNLHFDIALIIKAIKTFVSEEDRALAYATILDENPDRERTVAKAFEVDEALLQKYTQVLAESRAFHQYCINKKNAADA